MMAKFRMSYAYDVPAYFDFVIEADSAEEALALAAKALEDNVFDDIECTPAPECGADNFRVFIDAGEVSEAESQGYPELSGNEITGV